MRTTLLNQSGSGRCSNSGQATVFVVFALGIFLLGAMAFAVDMANLWYHRQSAQTAADAACVAGGMDLLIDGTNHVPNQGGFIVGTSFDCAGTSGVAPCQYAALNGYDGKNLSPGNDVFVDFPATVAGVAALPPGMASYQFIRVKVTDHVQNSFSALLSGQKTQDVPAVAVCGLVLATAPVPIVVLHPSLSGSLAVNGTPTISIVGGPNKSIQVNSSSTTAVTGMAAGTQAGINLACGGNGFTGSSLGVFGGPGTVGTNAATCPGTPIPGTFPPKGGGFYPGSTGSWQDPSLPISDPFASFTAPPVPGNPPLPTECTGLNCTILNNKCDPNTGIGTCTACDAASIASGTCLVGHNFDGCPDAAGCVLYTPGKYTPNGISVKAATAIFEPGLYYLDGGLGLLSGSMARPAVGPSVSDPQGYGGTMFYLTGTAQKCSGQTGLVCVGSDSGSPKAGFDPFPPPGTGTPSASSVLQCPGGAAPDASLGLPATLSGNVFLAPCSGPYADPTNQYRGMLFFQDRASYQGGGWGGGGGYLLAGSMYFHQCNSSGTGTGCSTPCTSLGSASSSSGFCSGFGMQGNAGATSYVLGMIITDTLSMGGGPTVEMALNPNATYNLLKVAILR